MIMYQTPHTASTLPKFRLSNLAFVLMMTLFFGYDDRDSVSTERF